MNFINKAVWTVLNPVSIGIWLLFAAVLFRRCRKLSVGCVIVAALWFYQMSTRMMTALVGVPLERDFLVDGRMPDAESYPTADAILDFGGGVGENKGVSKYAELFQAADRAYFAAVLWKAGKAPIIIPSGSGTAESDAKFLKDLGVPEKAVVVENAAKNTEENARFIADAMNQVKVNGQGQERKSRVLAVTSAWHMKRSLLMMQRYAKELEVIPAPCDFEATMATRGGFDLSWLKPDAGVFYLNSYCLHEWIGYWGYKWFRSWYGVPASL